MDLSNTQSRRVEWTWHVWGYEPQWPTEPDLNALESILRSLGHFDVLSLPFLAQGAFNKLYKVEASTGIFVMRVTLPVDPHYKTLSEVATIDWVRHNTSIPVPRVIDFRSNDRNPLGFEWMLMTEIPGKPLADMWKALQYETKSQLVKKFAAYAACLFRKQFTGIGNIYPHMSCNELGTMVDRMVSMQLFWRDRLRRNTSKGPFRTSKDWITTVLLLCEHDCHDTLAQSADEAKIDDAQRTLKIVKRLQPLVEKVFPAGEDQSAEPSTLFHDDLSQHNILVDENGNITGVVDWECVSALPLWKACYFPSFLEDRPRSLMPDIERYCSKASGQPSDLYWEHLAEFECTQLRQLFLSEMKRIEPEWIEIFESSQMKRDFDLAVRSCDNEFFARGINGWIDDIVAGKDDLQSLDRRLN